MPARRRKRKVAVNTKLIIDVIAASLIVQKAPLIVSQFIQLDPMISKISGVGVGYLVGMMMKRPELANASIALGVTDFVSPMIDDIIGGENIALVTNGAGSQGALGPPDQERSTNVADYFTLNDYIGNPSIRMSSATYRDSY